MTMAEKWKDVARRHEEKAKMLDKFGLSKEAQEHREFAARARETAKRLEGKR